METKDRVIVIDLTGQGDEAAQKAGKGEGHECRCGACRCGGKDALRDPETRLGLVAVTEPEALRRSPHTRMKLPSAAAARASKGYRH